MKERLKRTSWPVIGPSPPVNWPGDGWMPFSTELLVVNEGVTIAATDSSSAALLERDAKATSEGELTRVGTFAVRVVSESFGKTR